MMITRKYVEIIFALLVMEFQYSSNITFAKCRLHINFVIQTLQCAGESVCRGDVHNDLQEDGNSPKPYVG